MKKPHQPTITERLTRAVGSTTSLIFHTAIFAGFFIAGLTGTFAWDTVLLVLTTLVSLEAIYLSIFIQMSVNKNTESLAEVEEDIGEIEENLEEIQEDIGEIEENLDEIQEDVGEIEENLDEIQEDVGEIHEEVDELAEEDTESEKAAQKTQDSLDRIQEALTALTQEIEHLKKSR
jgi:septal ring factor EnvC (AmiA/AmiB activator)